MSKDMALRNSLRQHMAQRNILVEDERSDLPVELVDVREIPLRGSVHVADGRTVSRDRINKLFRKARFA